MSLTSGTRLGVYEIAALIGAGGMGEVYRARDATLNRDVALKVLPELFALDPDRLARFKREAQVLASLNHPNIAAIYGFEESSSVQALVLELVEGPTLADRIAHGPMPVDEALPIARQIAEALEAAHEQGIVHRDLKPANIKLRADGTVKVLDFGLAKALDPAPRATDVSQSPTITSPAMTGMGVILGTAAYMSPEQAKGRATDKRSDIWAFGCVLYEMLTGKRAFGGEDVTDILAAVVRAEPDWQALPAAIPAQVRALVRRCLQKDKALRLRDAGDAGIELKEALIAPATGATPLLSRRRRALSSKVAALIGMVALVVGVVVGAWLRPASMPQGGSRVARLTLSLPPGAELAETPVLALSPDGTQLAYVATRGGVEQVYLRALDNEEAKPLPGTEGASHLFYSPDGQWLGFVAAGKIKKISTSGGVAVTLADGGANGASWGPDDTIVFKEPLGTNLMEISAAGGTAHPFATLDATSEQGVPQYPELLPGGRAILFTSTTPEVATADEKSIEVLTPETGERKVLIRGGSYARYLSTGHLVFLRSGTLMAVPFDLGRLDVRGPPVPVIEGIRESGTGVGAFSCSRDGSCVYVAGGMAGAQRTVALVDRTGVSQPLPLVPQSYSHPRFSPAGDKVSFWIGRVNCDVMVYEIARGALARFTVDGDNHFPIWTPDGKRITYISRKATAGYELFWKPADGSGPEQKLIPSNQDLDPITPLSWSPDGMVLAFADRGDIWLLPLSGERKPRPFFQSRFNESNPAFSPDGHWLAYVSDESGRPEVYVQPFPGPGAKYAVSTEGGTEPVWPHSGRELFYRDGDRMMAVQISAQPTFSAAKPTLLFDGPYVRTAGRPNYDVSPDGSRILMIKESPDEQHATQINVVLNWFEELRARVPPTN